jgi:hypothetical protein
MWKELTFQPILDSLMEEDFFYHKLKELEVRMKWQILEVILAFISFLHSYDSKRGHNMLALMLNPRFKSMRLITIFLGCENATIIIVEYDQQLLLPLLTKKPSWCLLVLKKLKTCNLKAMLRIFSNHFNKM